MPVTATITVSDEDVDSLARLGVISNVARRVSDAIHTALNHADRRYRNGTPYDNDPAAPDCSDLDRCRWPDDPDHADECVTYALNRPFERGNGE